MVIITVNQTFKSKVDKSAIESTWGAFGTIGPALQINKEFYLERC